MCIKGISGRDAYEIPYLFKGRFNNGYEITGDGFLDQRLFTMFSLYVRAWRLNTVKTFMPFHISYIVVFTSPWL